MFLSAVTQYVKFKMRQKKRILYLMSIDWSWIKQRPHFIAEKLNKEYDVSVVYKYKYRRKNLQKRNDKGIKLIPIFLFPKLDQIEKLKFINDSIHSLLIKILIYIKRPDYLYFTYPISISCIPHNYRNKIIYDCMDNHIEFLNNINSKKLLSNNEKELCDISDYIFVSSKTLKEIIIKRYGITSKKISIIRNAFDGNILDLHKTNRRNIKTIKLAYIGTISSWFDIDLLIKSCDDFKTIEYHLFGPNYNMDFSCYDRIYYHGVVEHDRLYETISDMDILIMPFKVNYIIESVDPVKFYEYINFNKPIFSIYYEEIDRYKKFINFYSDYDSYKKILNNYCKNKYKKYSQEDRLNFLRENTWDNRVNEIKKIID